MMAAMLPLLAAMAPVHAAVVHATRSCRSVTTLVPPRSSDNPFGITAGPRGMWIATGDRIDRLHDGTFHQYVLHDRSTADAGWLAWDHRSPYIWFADRSNARIGTLNVHGVIRDHDIPAGPLGAASAQSLVITKRFVWFTDQTNNRIGRFNRATRRFAFYPVPTADSEPVGMVRGHDGQLYFVERNVDKIGRLDPTTRGFTEWTLPSGAFPNRLAVDPSGNVWFTELVANSVGRIGTHGHLRQFHVGGGPVGLTYYRGALFTPLYSIGKLAEVNLRGNVVRRWTLPSAAGVLQVAAHHHHVYITDGFANHVYRVHLAC